MSELPSDNAALSEPCLAQRPVRTARSRRPANKCGPFAEAAVAGLADVDKFSLVLGGTGLYRRDIAADVPSIGRPACAS